MSLMEIVATVSITLFSLRTLLLLLKPDLHARLVATFYVSKTKRVVYLALFLFGAWLILFETTISHFIVALVTIGALYDYLFTLFPEQATLLINEAEAHWKRAWVFAVAVPLVSAVWLYLFLLLR
jgi:membrane-bound ClpP family serine protease